MSFMSEKIYTDEHVIDLVINDKRIMYVAVITTEWHYIGARQIIKKYFDEKMGIIMIARHEVTGFCIENSRISNECSNARVIMYEYDGSGMIYILLGMLKKIAQKKSCRKVSIICPEKPWLRFGMRLCGRKNFVIDYYVFDEGLGTYMRSNKYYYDGVWYYVNLLKSKFESILTNKSYVVDRNLFISGQNDKLICRKEILKEYKEWVNNKIDVNEITTNEYAIISLQTYHLEKGILNNADLKCLIKTIKCLKKIGYEVYIKCHPREKDIRRYSCLQCDGIIEYSGTQEVLINNVRNKPNLVLGFTTTTLLTMNLFEGIKTISLINLIDRNDIKGLASKDFCSFNKLFNGVVYIPNSYEELYGFVKCIK